MDHLRMPFRENDARRSLDSLSEFMLRTGHLPLLVSSHSIATARDVYASKYRLAMGEACVHRLAFLTENSHPGLGPKTTKRGDVFAVLYGCKWPVILRPMQESGHYDLLDVAYVYGNMFGEAVREHRAAGKHTDVFHIH
ncbi:hypothetical protein LTR95_000587 [Oleoguttula sp. CCFEE 5521]